MSNTLLNARMFIVYCLLFSIFLSTVVFGDSEMSEEDITSPSAFFVLGNVTSDFYLSAIGLGNCQGKLITDNTGNITCGVDATGGITDYVGVAMINESVLNDTYLFRGENLTVDDWVNVAFLNNSVFNDTYLRSMDLTNIAFLNDSVFNNTYLTGIDWTNVLFVNESVLNDTYALNSSLSVYDPWAYNQTTDAIDYVTSNYYNQSVINSIIPSSLTYYFYDVASSINATYMTMNTTQNPSTTTRNVSGLLDGDVIVYRINENTNLTGLFGNALHLHTTVTKTAGNKDLQIQGQLNKYQPNGTIASIATTDTSPILITGVSTNINLFASVPQQNLDINDMLLWQLNAVVTGGGTAPAVSVEVGGVTNNGLDLPVTITNVILDELDPVFLAENGSLWTEALNKYNSTYDIYSINQSSEFDVNQTTQFDYNQTTPAIDYVDGLGFLTSSGANLTYLFIGENLTNVDWSNVLFVNESTLNSSYLLVGQNDSNPFNPADIVFSNESLLNNSYLLKGENVTFSDDLSNVAFVNQSDVFSGDVNVSGDVFFLSNGLLNCVGKLVTDSTGNITCGVDATGGITDYVGVAMINESTLNDTYLFRGENLTVDDWVNVAFLNDSVFNDTYLRSMDLTNIAFLNDSVFNNTYLTGIDWTNVLFHNDSLLNSTYVRLDDINNSYLQNDTDVKFNTIEATSSNVTSVIYAQNISFGDAGSVIYWNGSNIIWQG